MRLTNKMKEVIAAAVLEKSPQRKELDGYHQEMAALYEEFRKVAIVHEDKKLLALEKSINKRLKAFADSPAVPESFKLYRGGWVYFVFSGGTKTDRFDFGEDVLSCQWRAMTLPRGDYQERYEKLKSRIHRSQETYDRLVVEVRAAVNAATTIKKLVEAWPEVATFIPKDLKPISAALVIPTEALNEKLGLKAVAD